MFSFNICVYSFLLFDKIKLINLNLSINYFKKFQKIKTDYNIILYIKNKTICPVYFTILIS